MDWQQERAHATALLEEAEMAVEEEDEATAWKETAVGRILNQQIRELHNLVEEIEEGSRKGRNSAYLAAWQAKQEAGR
ncbi:hypothetical protein ACGF12_38435 [Kitasatospora sp. NPDC048296]|uniref:hypothetical protein n=1 Tax=Kitasatospora sp. NPDC048296 TaxID=3364048 RepID=UPI00372230B9